MMNKKMEEVAVSTNDGLIEIDQPSNQNNNDYPIIIHPDQVDLLVKWLQEAQKELCEVEI